MEAVKANNRNTKKEQMLEALEKSLGIVSTACKMVDVGRTTHYAMAQGRPGIQEGGRLYSGRRSRLRRIPPLQAREGRQPSRDYLLSEDQRQEARIYRTARDRGNREEAALVVG